MKCPECGFIYCMDTLQAYGCLSCDDKHEIMHKEWEARQRFRRSVGLTEEMAGYLQEKWCQCCEERVGVTNHICKKTKKAIDYLDFLRNIP